MKGHFAAAVALAALLAACAEEAGEEKRHLGPRLVIVEEHQHAWPVWIEARERGELIEPAIHMHFDAHEDLGEPDLEEPLPDPVASEVARRLAREELDVDDVVLPALFSGLTGEVHWFRPPWLTDDTMELSFHGRGHLLVGSEGGERRRLRCSVPGQDPKLPDERTCVRWELTLVPGLRRLLAERGPRILDIDLDFFACENPHVGHTDEEIPKEEYERLREGARVKLEGRATDGDELTESVILARPPGPFEWPVRLDRIENTADGTVRYVRGFTCMGKYGDAFPVHRPSDEELDALVAEVEETLRRWKLAPAVITLARSARSGFVDPARVDAIQAKVVAMLRRVFPGLTIAE